MSDVTDENLRTEYRALNSHLNTMIIFRVATTGFFLVALGLILQVRTGYLSMGFLLAALSIGIWIVELRNRTVFYALVDRARGIERLWASKQPASPENGEQAYRVTYDLAYPENARRYPLFHRLTWYALWQEANRSHPEAKLPEPPREKISIFWRSGFPIPFSLTHSLGFDIIYGAATLYGLWYVVLGLRCLIR